jgi:hypothetical protein
VRDVGRIATPQFEWSSIVDVRVTVLPLTGISILTSRPTKNVHPPVSMQCSSQVFECRAFPTAAAKSQSQKLTLLPPIPQTLFLL